MLLFVLILVVWGMLPVAVRPNGTLVKQLRGEATSTPTPSSLADPTVSGQMMPDISAARTNPSPTPNLTPTRKITKSYYLRNRNGTLALIRTLNGVKYVIRIEEFSGEEMPTLTAVTPPG